MSSQRSAGPCHRCGRGGHLARECSLHVCFRCNGRGHMAWECLEGVTCSRCGEKGHLQRNCKNISCHKCGRKGHISKFCIDPFAKAEEVEKNEQNQALLKSRIAFDRGSAKDGATSTASGSRGCQKVSPGPWDGLGDLGQDRTSLGVVGVAFGKLGANRSQNSGMGNVTIVNVKRQLNPETHLNATKRRRQHNCDDLEANISANGAENPPFENTSKVEESILWNAMLDYGHEDSRDDTDSTDHKCDRKELVLLNLIANVDDTNVDERFADYRNGSVTSLQSS